MEMIIFGVYWIVLILLFGVYSINKCNIRKISSKIEERSVGITYDEIEKQCMQYLNNNEINNVQLEFSEVYCFDAKNNILKILKRQKYSEYDIFICHHEMGHIIDFNSRYRKLYKLIAKTKVIFYILWIPVLCISLCLVLGKEKIQNGVLLLDILEIGAGLFIIAAIVFIECSASKHAIQNLKFFDNTREFEFNKIAMLSVADQVIYWGITIHPLLYVLYLVISMS